VWPAIKTTAEEVSLLDNLHAIQSAARSAGIQKVIVACIESIARYAMELGYHVALVKDVTAAFKREMMHAAHELNGPTYAHSIVDTRELIQALHQD
jgi:nicotinamidase-related amidase